MTINFPDAPVANQVFSDTNKHWVWDGEKWLAIGGEDSIALAFPLAEIYGGTGVTDLDRAPVMATGSTTLRTLGNRAAEIVNVKDFGAVMDGSTIDTNAFNAAVAAVSSRGTIVVPPGGFNGTGFTNGWAAKPILWRLSGNNFGTGSTGVNTIGNGVVESFFSNTTKFFGRSSSRSTYTGTAQVAGLGPVVRIDMQLDHTGGVVGGIEALQINASTSASSAPATYPFALTAKLTLNSTQPSGPPGTCFSAVAERALGAGTQCPFAMNPQVTDFTMLPSGTGGSLVNSEFNLKANKLDNGTLADGLHQNGAVAHPGVNRGMLDLKYGRTDRADNSPMELSCVINIGVYNATEEAWCSTKNAIRINSNISFAGLNMMNSVMMGEANAIALGSEHRLAWTVDDADAVVPTNFRYFQYTKTGTDRLRYMVGTSERFAISDNGGLSSPSLPTNVLFYGAVLNGVASDFTAFQAAYTATPGDGTIVVPRGIWNTTGPSFTRTDGNVLWKLDGNHFSSGVPVSNAANDDVTETFLSGRKYFGKHAVNTGSYAVVNVNLDFDNPNGSLATHAGLKVTGLARADCGDAYVWLHSAELTSDTNGVNQHVAGAFTMRKNGTAPVFGLFAQGIDQTGQPSSVKGNCVACEIDLFANLLDDSAGGLGGRAVLSLVWGRATTGFSSAPMSVARAFTVGPKSADSLTSSAGIIGDFGGRFTTAGINLGAAVQVSGNAIWLATNQTIALDRAGTGTAAHVTLKSDGNHLVLGQMPTNAANDAAASAAGVPVGGVYRNASVLMVRAA